MLTSVQVFGTCKVKDGLYIGDEFTAKNIEFIIANKVGYIVNCSSDQLENLFEGVGVMYFSFQWPELQPELVVQQEFINHVCEFIEESEAQGQSCLIASMHGQSRACSMVTIYLMQKYHWSLYKTLDYLNSRRNDLEIKTSFFEVLKQVEVLFGPESLTKSWEITKLTSPEEIIIINTYHNAQAKTIDSVYTLEDEFQRINNKSKIQLIKFREQHIQQQQNPNNAFKSILKGSKNIFYKIQPQQQYQQQQQQQQQQQLQQQIQKVKQLKSLSVNKENVPELIKKQILVPQKQQLRSVSIPKGPAVKKQSKSSKQIGVQKQTGNQVVYPINILRPKMPNFDNL